MRFPSSDGTLVSLLSWRYNTVKFASKPSSAGRLINLVQHRQGGEVPEL